MSTLFLSCTNLGQFVADLKEIGHGTNTVFLNVTYLGRRDADNQVDDVSSLLGELEEAARKNTTIEKLVISGGNNNGNIDAAALHQGQEDWNQRYQSIIRALGHLVHLKELQLLRILTVTFDAVVGPSLSSFFENARHLTSFRMDRVAMEPSTGHHWIPEWSSAIRDHPVLQELVVDQCSVGGQDEDDVHQNCIFYPFLIAVSALPTLTRVSFKGFPILPALLISQSAIQDMCQRATANLIHLEYMGVPLDQPPLGNATLRASLAQLQTLQTNIHFTKEEYQGIATLLEQSTTLESLRLHSPSLHFTWGKDYKPLHEDYREGMIDIANALRDNRSVRFLFIMDFPPTPKATKQAFVEALEVNYTLQHINVFQRRVKQLEFLTTLNRRGRGDILVGWKPREEWIDKLVSEKEDLDSLFYYLLANPSLCENGVGA